MFLHIFLLLLFFIESILYVNVVVMLPGGNGDEILGGGVLMPLVKSCFSNWV